MADEKKPRAKKKDRAEEGERNFIVAKFVEYRSEFRKIVWPSREELLKHTITTIVISLIFGVIIAVMDGAFSYIFNNAVNWFA
ncbi:MAG: preprotein translocase subunit SecE [Defluviitaleaceae bacterium]|nr:preprotein translocase subunit SecE [Defluviitaleaceae bacterium]